ncbi:MAG: hypothetical protein WCV81_01290 [Microgenomates group bacterium]|jgi:hypothetical protein
MKEFVFLYPIQEYLDGCVGSEAIRRREGWEVCQRFNEIVEARYRQRGFGVSWVMFSDPNEHQLPDFSIKAKEIEIKPEDHILVAGVSFLVHKTLKEYPDPLGILSQLPSNLERLVIGGFHQNDCVDKLGQAVYEKGISTVVDEDTTDVFFISMRYSLTIPLIRDEFPIEEEVPPTMLYLLKERLSKPWFTQF